MPYYLIMKTKSSSRGFFIVVVDGQKIHCFVPKSFSSRVEAGLYVEHFSRTRPQFGYIVLNYDHPMAAPARAAAYG